MTEPVYLALGTNLGNRAENLASARGSLAPKVRIIKASSVYVTPPWGFDDQPDYLNQVLEVQTDMDPLSLLDTLKAIEADMGRLKTFRYGPRLIDLDILFYGHRILQSDLLQIPHPRLHERAFVLVPLNEIAADFVHPVMQESIAALLAKVSTEGVRAL